MFRIGRIGWTFLRKSKMLTFSAFFSIFIACFLSISMFQLASNVRLSLETSFEAKKGVYDLQVTKAENACFTKEDISFIEQEKGVKQISTGYWSVELLDTYMVGVVDDAMNKSLYKYTKDLDAHSIIINEAFGRQEKKKLGDSILLGDRRYQIIEVLKPGAMSDYKMPMAILSLQELHELLGHEDVTQANYMLLQCFDSAFQVYGNQLTLAARIQQHSPEYQVMSQYMAEDYRKMLTNVQTIFKVFFLIVMLISGLFVVSIFTEYMRKYKKDMAIMRTVGGKQKQVLQIFCGMSLIISAVGCLSGALFSALVSKAALEALNQKVQLFDGSVRLDWKALWQITLTVFVLFHLFVYVVFRLGQKVLPIQVFRENKNGLTKGKGANRFLWLRNLVTTEGYLGIKLMMPKLRQNVLMLLVVALITALSYTGQASLRLLMANDNWYNYNRVEGKQGVGELSASQSISLSYARKLKERLQPALGKHGFFVYGDFPFQAEEDKTFSYFELTDMEHLPEFLCTDVLEGYEAVPKAERLVLEESVAAEHGYTLGERISLTAECLGGTKEFVLVEIIKADNLNDLRYEAILDWDNLCEEKLSSEEFWGSDITFWFDGEQQVIQEKCQQLQVEFQQDYNWSLYDEMLHESDQIVYRWSTTWTFILAMLLLVAGTGLLNSAKGMIQAKKEEYKILRMLGVTRRRVRRICWMQIISYMLSGVILGTIVGAVLVFELWNSVVHTNAQIEIYWEYIVGIVIYLMVLAFCLTPTVRKFGK